jgi:HSP20 family protein
MLVDRWFPFFDVSKTLEEMERVFNRMGQPLGLRSVPQGTFPAVNIHDQDDAIVLTAEAVRREEQARYFQPATDIVEAPDAVVLKFDMPGVTRENVDITVDQGTLTVAGKAEPEESGQAVYRETYVGDYRRQFTLAADVDPEKITAVMNDGVLTVTIGKAERAKPKRIEITAAQ